MPVSTLLLKANSSQKLQMTQAWRIAKLVLHLYLFSNLNLQIVPSESEDPQKLFQPHISTVPHLTYLSSWVNYYEKCLPQSPIIKRDSKGQQQSGAAFMRTLRWKFPVDLNAREFTLGCKNNTYCYISSLYLLSSAEITAVCAAS